MSRLGVVLASLGLLLVASPSYAHSTDARIVSVLDEVRPALPDAVRVQVRANLAAQVLVDNPTEQPLEVLAPTGEPFLRISRVGVFANLGSPEFFATSNPNGIATRPRGPDRFVQISSGTAWGWYDHRLHPTGVQAPADSRRRTRLASFDVPLRYAGSPVTASGHLEYRPLLGGFEDTVRAVPQGMTAAVLQGRLPGLFVTVAAPLTVLGSDGEPFLRSDGQALSVNTASRTYVEDQQARGASVDPPSLTPRWKAVTGTSYTWLDARLRYASDAPPESALRTAAVSVIGTWSIPVQGAPTALSGEVRWVPAEGAAPPSRRSRAPLASALGGALVLLLLAAVVVRRRRR